MSSQDLSGVCFVSSFRPRECGIATFTQSIIDNLDFPKERIKIVAVSDKPNFYSYGPEVIAEIVPGNAKSFISAAKKINKDPSINIINLQHVFSLFEGKYGDNITLFLKNLRKPLVTTFHMVYPKESSPHKFEVVESTYSEITKEIIEHSRKIIVIIPMMADMLRKQYGVSKEKIEIIPHGAPFVPMQNPEEYKEKLNLGRVPIISSFGLIRPKKGLEYVIYAMPKIIKKYPGAKFLILGETHPNRPPEYHSFLKKEAKKLGLLNKNVIFKNKYLTFQEILDYIFATDVFITPYLVPEQTSSGAIAYAMGCGKAIISTPFAYAKEVLAEKRGLFINYNDPESIFLAVDFFLSHPNKRKRMEKLAYEYAQKNSFQKVARKYLRVFQNI